MPAMNLLMEGGICGLLSRSTQPARLIHCLCGRCPMRPDMRVLKERVEPTTAAFDTNRETAEVLGFPHIIRIRKTVPSC